jgi:hypothetical protein
MTSDQSSSNETGLLNKKRWLRFSLRRLFIAVTLVAIAIAMVFRPAYQQQTALRQAQSFGWDVYVKPRYFNWRSSLLDEGDFAKSTDSFSFHLRQRVVGILIVFDMFPPATGAFPSPESLNVLAKFPKLRWLTIHLAPPSDSRMEDHAQLAELPQLDSLETLFINRGGLHDDGVERIVSRIPKVRHLRLRHSATLTSRSVRHLARLNYLESLELIDVAIDDGAAEGLRRLTQLERLDLSGTNVGDQTARALATLPRLTDLSITGHKDHRDGIRSDRQSGKAEKAQHQSIDT